MQNEVLEVVAEEVTLENTIQQELVKANVTDAVIAELHSRYGGLRLNSVDDKESYLEIKAAVKECSKIRNLAGKICKAGREDAVKIQKLWVSKEKEVIARIAEVEDVLDAEVAKYDAELKRKEDEEAQRKENEYMTRTQILTKMGASFSNGEFTLGEFSIEANLVKDCSQEVWDAEMYPKFYEQYQIIEAVRIEEQRKKDEEAAELKRKQDELIEQQRLFQEQQAEFQRKQQEAERAEQQKRLDEQKAQAELNNKRLQLIAPFNPYNKGVDTQNLHSLTEEAFIALVDDTKAKFEQEQDDAKVKMQEEIAAKERVRIQNENNQKELQRQQDEQRKAEELAASGDKANWNNFIEQLNNLTVPTVNSGRYKKIYGIAKEKIEEILALKP